MTVKEKVNAAKQIFGTHVNLTDPIVTEILASLGYDFIWVDMEHTGLSCEQVYHHLLAARACGTPVFVRVPADDLTVTKRVLEMGIDGIVFPMVRDAEHAKQLLDYTLYPPYGRRGCGPKGAVRYGLQNEAEYYCEGHLKLCRFVQIEQATAAQDAESIAALPYLDGCVLGMHDLSGSIDRLGDIFCEENLALANHAISAFKAAGKTIGISTFAIDNETLQRYRKMGINMISTGADYDYIARMGTATLNTLRNLEEEL
jgi:2-dehydro-3-deoxyglucarate aldolase/4-hydroxy-2-oxoheptanedioate aldolase